MENCLRQIQPDNSKVSISKKFSSKMSANQLRKEREDDEKQNMKKEIIALAFPYKPTHPFR